MAPPPAEEQVEMRAHESAHVERREPVEQSVPDDGDEAGRDEHAESAQRVVRELAARDGARAAARAPR